MQAQDNGGAVFPSYSELQVQFSNRPLDEKASRSTVRTCSMMRPGASLAAACKTRSPICWRRCAKRRTASLISIDGMPEFVPPVVSEPEIPARPRQKWDISKLVAEIRAQYLGSG